MAHKIPHSVTRYRGVYQSRDRFFQLAGLHVDPDAAQTELDGLPGGCAGRVQRIELSNHEGALR